MEKIAKLVPSEVIAGYLALTGFVDSISWEYTIYAMFGLCLILTPLYLNRQAVIGKPKFMHLIISTIAFIVWAIATTGTLLFSSSYQPAVGSVLLIAFSLISGLVPLNRETT